MNEPPNKHIPDGVDWRCPVTGKKYIKHRGQWWTKNPDGTPGKKAIAKANPDNEQLRKDYQ